MRTQRSDFTALGWAMFITETGPELHLTSLLDQVDDCYDALLAGRAGGYSGLLLAENPHRCAACKNAWAQGHAEGNARRLAEAPRVGRVQ